jgi:hypothetical protein
VLGISIMPRKFFTVTITATGGSTSYAIFAETEQFAIVQARKYAGLPEDTEVGVEVAPDIVSEPQAIVEAPADIGFPRSGWIINGTSPDGKILVRQYLVAIEDAEYALETVMAHTDQGLVIALGASVDSGHFVRRKMKRGDVFELGIHRVARGKNRKS